MEHRITVTMSELGLDEVNAERLLEAFVRCDPNIGAVMSQNLREGTLAVTFSVDAADAQDAIDVARNIFFDGFKASGLEPTRIVGLEATAVSASAGVPDPALQPA